MLVLETEEDYARYRIDRRALADILTVDEGRVRLRKRSGEMQTPAVIPDTGEARAPTPASPGDGRAAGAPPSAGPRDPLASLPRAAEHAAPATRGQSTGSGRGRLSRHVVSAPRVRMGATTVSGRVPPES